MKHFFVKTAFLSFLFIFLIAGCAKPEQTFGNSVSVSVSDPYAWINKMPSYYPDGTEDSGDDFPVITAKILFQNSSDQNLAKITAEKIEILQDEKTVAVAKGFFQFDHPSLENESSCYQFDPKTPESFGVSADCSISFLIRTGEIVGDVADQFDDKKPVQIRFRFSGYGEEQNELLVTQPVNIEIVY